MKNIRFIAVIMLVLPVVASAKFEIAPYSSINFSEGLGVPSLGSALLSTNLSADLGAVVKPMEKHTFFAIYSLKYDGPGFKRQEGRQFTERSLDHIFVVQHQYAINERYSVKERVSSMIEYYRSGANEAWGKGLYDFNRTGLFASFLVAGFPEIPLEFFKDINAEASFSYDILTFPNYTDLLKEFQNTQGESTTESATGKQDQNIYQIGLAASKYSSRLALKYTIQSYTKQKTIAATGVYGSDLQQDNVLSLEFLSKINVFKDWITIVPNLSYSMKKSNQNYLYFKTISVSSQSFTFLGNYYDYTEFSLSTEFDFHVAKNKTIFLLPEFDWKNYSSRPAMSTDYSILPEKQSVALTVFTLGYQVKWNEVSTWTLFFTQQQQSSTMKFEKYVPYNYTGNYYGMKFSFTY